MTNRLFEFELMMCAAYEGSQELAVYTMVGIILASVSQNCLNLP